MTRDDEGLRLLEEYKSAVSQCTGESYRDGLRDGARGGITLASDAFDALHDAYDALRRHLQGEDT